MTRILLPVTVPILLLLGTAMVPGQEAGPAAAPPPTLRVTTRLVYVDVLVRDAGGKVVKGLTDKDFKVFEDGRPQTVDFFTAHGTPPATVPVFASNPAPGPTEFTNVTASGPSRAITIVLCDLLNTPFDDQLTGRQQMLKFLHSLPQGERIALFTLGSRLQMTQGESGSESFLDAAARILTPMATGLRDEKTETQQDAQIAANAGVQFGPHFGATAGENAIPAINAQTDEGRARGTIAALGQLARAMSSYPGRKSLYWIAESFPLSIEVAGANLNTGPSGSAMQFDTRLIALQSHFDQTSKSEMRNTLNQLASARIAVYPVSVFGLATQVSSPAVSGSTVFGTNAGDPRGGFFDLNNLKFEMNDLARETGGEAIFGNNDLAGTMLQTMEDGGSYYTIAYKPTNDKWNGQFRAIHLETQGGLSLIYRRGYFATPDGSATDAGDDLQRAMQPGVPEETALRLRSRILPPDPQHPGLTVESTINPADVAFAAMPDGHQRAKLFIQLVAFNDAADQPKAVPQTSGTLNIDLDQQKYEFIQSAGIAFRQQLALKPGKYRLLLGVSDENSHKPGTLEMSVTVPAS